MENVVFGVRIIRDAEPSVNEEDIAIALEALGFTVHVDLEDPYVFAVEIENIGENPDWLGIKETIERLDGKSSCKIEVD